jgi:hypothetical protein
MIQLFFGLLCFAVIVWLIGWRGIGIIAGVLAVLAVLAAIWLKIDTDKSNKKYYEREAIKEHRQTLHKQREEEVDVFAEVVDTKSAVCDHRKAVAYTIINHNADKYTVLDTTVEIAVKKTGHSRKLNTQDTVRVFDDILDPVTKEKGRFHVTWCHYVAYRQNGKDVLVKDIQEPFTVEIVSKKVNFKVE